MVAAQPPGAFFGAAGAHHEVTAWRECLDQEVEHALFVIDDQDRPVGPAFEGFVGRRRKVGGFHPAAFYG
ncbi:hypothetical protein D9M69_610760 [compost metagenome]